MKTSLPSAKTIIRTSLLGGLFLLIVVYAVDRTSFLAKGSDLEIQTITDGQIFDRSKIELAGTALRTVSLTINNREVAINEEGFFKDILILSPGINFLSVTAKDKFDKQESIQYSLFYQTQEEYTLETLLEQYKTTAYQRSVSEPPLLNPPEEVLHPEEGKETEEEIQEEPLEESNNT